MQNAVIQEIENRQKKTDVGNFRAGDTVKVHQRIIEGAGDKKKERIQIFEGVVIARYGKGINEMVSVRKVVDGVGVEKAFPIHTKTVAKIELVKYGKSRRARLFYLRDLVGSKITRVKEDLQKNIEEAARRSALRKEQDKQREQAKLAEKAAKEAEEKAAAKAKKEAEAKEAEEKKKAAETKKAEETKTETPPDTPTA